jgi:hypothetical protein
MSAVPNIFERLARNDNGKILRTSEDNYLDHRQAREKRARHFRTHPHDNLPPAAPTER